MGYDPSWAPYVSVGERQGMADRTIKRLKKKGYICNPVEIAGRSIATSFWGKAWCNNLTDYSDYAYRLQRGSAYVKNGLVIDLQIEEGVIRSMVSGTELYNVRIDIKPLPAQRWKKLCQQCTGELGSLIELLQGKLSTSVMNAVIAHPDGLFPEPRELKFNCDCPDVARLCKHVAATLYGVGARLDTDPALLFRLRGVDPQELMAKQTIAVAPQVEASSTGLTGVDLSAMFGIDLAGADSASAGSVEVAPQQAPTGTGVSAAPAKAAKKTVKTTLKTGSVTKKSTKKSSEPK
jgi:uncharacterized Zn finger protein